MNDSKQQIAERIKQANNILVTVSSNPSVDQLAACIGLTLALNKDDKHATAVFSGEVPSTIEFLQPEKTLEKNTDSLRDFIIALDKSKADKLRYKVEDTVVKIFITPYRTSISDKDLEFSQGDFNVDVVLALGVQEQGDLDQAITAHGRILHDAVITTVNTRPGGDLGTINWLDPGASSLSELATELCDAIDKKLLDNQIATAFLTGIVAETERFSNAKTTPQTMSLSAELMSAGANQQLVATKLAEPAPQPPAPLHEVTPEPNITNNTSTDNHDTSQAGSDAQPSAGKPNDDGTLEIDHQKSDDATASMTTPIPPPSDEVSEMPAPASSGPSPESPTPQTNTDNREELPGDSQLSPTPLPGAGEPPVMPPNAPEPPTNSQSTIPSEPPAPADKPDDHPHIMTQPPTFESQLSAESMPGGSGFPSETSMSLPQVEPAGPLLNRAPLSPPVDAPPAPPTAFTPPVSATPTPPANEHAQVVPDSLVDHETLSNLERDVESPHLHTNDNQIEQASPNVDSARAAVDQAAGLPTEPYQSLNAQMLGGPLHEPPVQADQPLPVTPSADNSSLSAGMVNPATGMPPPQPAAPTPSNGIVIQPPYYTGDDSAAPNPQSQPFSLPPLSGQPGNVPPSSPPPMLPPMPSSGS